MHRIIKTQCTYAKDICKYLQRNQATNLVLASFLNVLAVRVLFEIPFAGGQRSLFW
jgi:hypothetical protein